MRAVDDAIIARLKGVGLNVHDGIVTVDTTTKKVLFPLPYVVYYGSLGIEGAPRLSGRRRQRTVGFMANYVGETREQAKWAGERVRTALSGVRLDIPGYKVGLIEIVTSPWVWRDDDMLRPDGQPVFYGRDTGEVPVFNVPIQEGP